MLAALRDAYFIWATLPKISEPVLISVKIVLNPPFHIFEM